MSRISCPKCKSTATVLSSREEMKDTPDAFLKRSYCRCTNPDCRTEFRVTTSFDHYLRQNEEHHGSNRTRIDFKLLNEIVQEYSRKHQVIGCNP
uniref:Ogr/Delta-like zinc finger n=1 Tax=Candidatus Kentrum sp. LFY TaxID=2126342 RepID=A0A450WI26_9GAMM|nr:MAG: Ogr/Delta-like zinc finger [Candidatus Kentron sp. LFY]